MKQFDAIKNLSIAAMLWGCNFHFSKIMLSESTCIEAGTVRYILGVAALYLFNRNSLKGFLIVRHFSKGALLTGLVGLFGFNILLFWGLQLSTPLNAALIVSLNPVFTALCSNYMLKTKFEERQIAATVIAIIGVLILLSKGQWSTLTGLQVSIGDLLIFFANIIFSIYHVWVKKYSAQTDITIFTFLTSTICLAAFLSVLPFTQVKALSNYSGKFWLAAAGCGVLSTAIGYHLWNKGVAMLGAAKAGIFMNIVPLTAAVFSFLLGEPLCMYHAVSGIIILSSIAFSQMKRIKK